MEDQSFVNITQARFSDIVPYHWFGH